MGTTERRAEILRVLCRRRHDTVKNLANEFSVSERTILRDIEALSLSEPIYTKQGKYGGGIYVLDGYSLSHMYMTDMELSVLQKLSDSVVAGTVCRLDNNEQQILKNILSQYTKPVYKKEK